MRLLFVLGTYCMSITLLMYHSHLNKNSHSNVDVVVRQYNTILLEVVIPNITFKFGANNLNFIRVRLGQVRLG